MQASATWVNEDRFLGVATSRHAIVMLSSAAEITTKIEYLD
jgi:hypothetical protein